MLPFEKDKSTTLANLEELSLMEVLALPNASNTGLIFKIFSSMFPFSALEIKMNRTLQQLFDSMLVSAF